MKPEAAAVIEARELTKSYHRGREEVRALDGASFQVSRGEWLAVTGPSGAGKTTLLNLIGCMDVPTSGSLRIGGTETAHLSERALTKLRRERIGFVFQHFGLLPTLTVRENVALPALFAGRRMEKRAAELLRKVGLESRRDHRPRELSGGEMQRVAVARALINSPEILLADEPTGNLDTATGEAVVDLFRHLHREGLTIVVVTHNERLAAAAGRRIVLRDGRIVG